MDDSLGVAEEIIITEQIIFRLLGIFKNFRKDLGKHLKCSPVTNNIIVTYFVQ